MKEKGKQTSVEEKPRPKKYLWIVFVLLFSLLACLAGGIFLFYHLSSSTNAIEATFDDLLKCLKESKVRYDEGYMPFGDYFYSNIQLENEEGDSRYSLTYQKEPFKLNKVIESNGLRKESGFSKIGEEYVLDGEEVDIETIQKEIENPQCGYASYLSYSKEHFDYLIQSISDFSQLEESSFKKKEIKIGEKLTYSCDIELIEAEDSLNKLSFNFLENRLQNLVEKSPIFSLEISFRFLA